MELDILSLKKEISDLKEKLQNKEEELRAIFASQEKTSASDGLTKQDVERFSRQIIVPGVGCEGQLALKASRILIVGVGGLGCPAAQYLTGAGVGHIGLVDYDTVEHSNLHRQLLHTERCVNLPKVSSASKALRKLNSNIEITEYHTQLNRSNALDILSSYHIVIDATDNVATRYLLNDACVLSKRPLVSGSALRLEGQLTVYNYNDGPCYRCLFPKPPPPETVMNCGDAGVLGAVPGIIGVLEALEAIKIVLKWPDVLSQQLLLFDAQLSQFRKVRLRTKNPCCVVCGDNALVSDLVDYEEFCQAKATDKDHALFLLKEDQRVSPEALQSVLVNNQGGLLIDVRDPEEFRMCALPHSINVPLKKLDDPASMEKITDLLNVEQKLKEMSKFPVYVICRRGNDSQRAVLRLEKSLRDHNVIVRDLKGGLHAWAKAVDSNFPVY